jgi:3-isopropylmalate/(R)-2-methylmalate dehydratase small subunit
MKPFRRVRGPVAVLDRPDVDTDQIVPKQFLKRIERTGFGQFLFFDWRFDPDGKPRPEFELNQPESAGAKILIAGANFGCGSSREHAPWALTSWGIGAIFSTGFADIFRNNALKNGLLPIEVDADTHARLFDLVADYPESELMIDLEEQLVHLPTDEDIPFTVDPFARQMLLAGTDEIGWVMSRGAAIDGWEAAHPARVDTRPEMAA